MRAAFATLICIGSVLVAAVAASAQSSSTTLPEMVRIPGQSFEVGRYEVTFAQWDACVAEGGCSGWRPNAGEPGRANLPVVNVSWDHAQSYVRWLSARTGQRYRLLTSAEWELAARAGATTNFSWGDQDPVCDRHARNGANFLACPGNGTGAWLRPVGSFRPNGYGLHDVHGNVREWVEGCRDPYCMIRTACGGSWNDSAQDLRFACLSASGLGQGNIGFRVARIIGEQCRLVRSLNALQEMEDALFCRRAGGQWQRVEY